MPTESEALASQVIGAAIIVHRELGIGCERSAYAEALAIELHLHDLDVERDVSVKVEYKGHTVGTCQADLLVGGQVAVELETDKRQLEVDTDRLRHYLKIARVPLGLVINFHAQALKNGVRRVRLSQG
ncbi:MAG: GxxExxY protein [Planctomycetota bacterium]|jgi:GxxExxY protein